MYRFLKYIVIFLIFIIGNNIDAVAQNAEQDSTFAAPPKSRILDLLEVRNNGGQLLINQEESTTSALKDYLIAKPRERRVGYRIIVYYDNDQKARNESREIESQLRSAYPAHKVYRSYASPYFIVYIGNFRTKIDAMELLNTLLPAYENAKIVKTRIAWYSFSD